MQTNVEATDGNSTEEEAGLGEKTPYTDESSRQREGSNHVGAFGKRTGKSDLVFFEGILPEEEGDVLNGLSTEEQAHRCFDRLETLLSERRVELADLLKVEVQVAAGTEIEAVDDVYQARFAEPYPPRTTVGVCSLPGGADVQLDVIAAQE